MSYTHYRLPIKSRHAYYNGSRVTVISRNKVPGGIVCAIKRADENWPFTLSHWSENECNLEYKGVQS